MAKLHRAPKQAHAPVSSSMQLAWQTAELFRVQPLGDHVPQRTVAPQKAEARPELPSPCECSQACLQATSVAPSTLAARPCHQQTEYAAVQSHQCFPLRPTCSQMSHCTNPSVNQPSARTPTRSSSRGAHCSPNPCASPTHLEP